jgi:leucyl-tRNA synthetase
MEVPVQINGKLRARLSVSAGINEATLREAALADKRVQELIAGKQVRKIIVVPGKLVNIVVS